MNLTQKQFEFLKFVQSGDDWHCDSFVALVQKYYKCRQQGVFTNFPFPYPPTPISSFSNLTIDILNADFRNTEYTNQDVYGSEEPITEAEYQNLVF